MKKALLLLCLAIGLALFVVALWPMQTVAVPEIPVLNAEEINALMRDRIRLPFDVLSFSACAGTLPRDADTDTWYVPALTDAVTSAVPHPWQIARTPQDDNGASRIILYSGTSYAECTLIETGLPVIDVQLKRFDLDPRYIGTERIGASADILSLRADGTLQRQTDRIEIKARGGSSIVYDKKSYTLFFLDTSGRDTLASPLGLPADRKFALNSLYEDDSKIRDALAYRLWAEIEPDNALRFTYAELLINDGYYGLYGMHGLPTENALPYSTGDTVYKINSDLETSPASYRGEHLPSYEIAAGDPLSAPSLREFLLPFTAAIDTFPAIYARENFVDFSVLMEVLACEDASLKNLLVTYDAAAGQYRLTGWDMDQSFGNVWNESSHLYVSPDASLATLRYLAPSEIFLKPLSLLYAACPDFRDDIAVRYRELRQSVFSDEALLGEAAALYDALTDCGARARDAARWENSAVSANNDFIEAFIPERMAFLDAEFAEKPADAD